MPAPRDLTGQTFGALTVICLSAPDGKHRCWKCRCACGKDAYVRGSALTTGNTKSCGCQKPIAIGNARRQHGRTETTEFHIWKSMIQRCRNPENDAYPRYGGRGITVCDRWNDFATFLADMGERPADLTLERIDNDGPYRPDNCRWGTRKEQARNRRNTPYVEYQGELLPLAEVAERAGIKYHTLYMRLFHRGWPLEKALHP